MISSLMCWALVKVSGAARREDEDPRHVLALLVAAGWPPDGASRHARQLHAIGPGDDVEAVDKGEHDRQQHAGLDRQRHDEPAARRHEQNLRPAVAVDADHLADAEYLQAM